MAVWIVRLIILLAGLALAGFMIWQLFTGARMLDFDVETRGPLIVVVFSLLLLITLGSAVSFFLGTLLAVMSFILWIHHPEQADIYRLYFIYGLVVGVLSPFVLDREK